MPQSIENVSVGSFAGCEQLKDVVWDCSCDKIPVDCFVAVSYTHLVYVSQDIQLHFIISLPFCPKNILSAMLVQICSTTLRFCTSSGPQDVYKRQSQKFSVAFVIADIGIPISLAMFTAQLTGYDIGIS